MSLFAAAYLDSFKPFDTFLLFHYCHHLSPFLTESKGFKTHPSLHLQLDYTSFLIFTELFLIQNPVTLCHQFFNNLLKN